MIEAAEHWRTLDDTGMMMPWYTRPCLAWLETLDFKDRKVFEFGCGESTKWFKSRGAITYGVDDLSKWLPKTHGYTLADNAADYLRAIDWKIVYDIIIIDGLYRDECTAAALAHLKQGGYLIADNFEQGSSDLAEWPLTRELTKNLKGTFYKEPDHIDWTTAVWQK